MASPTIEKEIFSFDGSTHSKSQYTEPDRYSSLFATIRNAKTVSLQGANLSPSLSSAFDGGLTINLLHFNRVLDFNAEKNLVTVEPGIKLGDLLKFLSSHNKWLSVLPGHPNITVGGCVGHNIHGKGKGYFRDIVDSLKLFHPQFEERNCSANENQELFELTVGGLGSTGLITSVTLKIEELKGRSIVSEKLPCKNLLDAIDLLKKYSSEKKGAVYSWNNFSITNEGSFGKGYVFIDRFDQRDKKSDFQFQDLTPNTRRSARFGALAPVLTSFFVPVYDLLQKFKPKEQRLGLFEGSFPISGKEVYYSAMGKKGFLEHQVLIPIEKAEEYGKSIREAYNKHKPKITLGSLKSLDGSPRYLRFCKTGILFTVNVHNNNKALPFLEELDQALIRCDGIPNLSKDSRLSRATIQKCYGPQFDQFLIDLKNIDPEFKFRSKLLDKILETQ